MRLFGYLAAYSLGYSCSKSGWCRVGAILRACRSGK
jgi:hypothetical protein